MVLSIILISGIEPSFSEYLSLKKQLELGIAVEEIQCHENRILVMRDNGNPACVSEKTMKKTGWIKIEKPIEQTLKIETKKQNTFEINNNISEDLLQLNSDPFVNDKQNLSQTTDISELTTKTLQPEIITDVPPQISDGVFKIKYPSFLLFGEADGSRYHDLHVDKVMTGNEIRKHWQDVDDQKYWGLINEESLLTKEHVSSFTKTSMELCKRDLNLTIKPSIEPDSWKKQHRHNHEIFLEKCRTEQNQIIDKNIIDSLSVYEKITRYNYLDIDPSEELWYLKSITIEKSPLDMQSTLNGEVYTAVGPHQMGRTDLIKHDSYEITLNDKLVKVTKYIKNYANMGNCRQEHIVLLEFTAEQETWYLHAKYPISCNIRTTDKVIVDTVFTDIVNSFEIYDYKHKWDMDLSDAPTIKPYDLLDDYGFSIEYDPEKWTLSRGDGYKSRHFVSFFSWGANNELDPFPGLNIYDDPKWFVNKINPQFFEKVPIPKDYIPEIFWITVQKIDITGKQWVDARNSVCHTPNTKVPKDCTVLSFEEKSIIVNDKPVKIIKYVEADRFPEENRYYQHHVFLIDLLDEKQTWIVHSTYLYASKELISEDIFLENIVNSFAVMGYEHEWYSVFTRQ